MKNQNLTAGESETLSLLVEGHTYLQIAHKLHLNNSTLHARVYRIRQKTGIRNLKDPQACLRYVTRHQPQLFPTAAQDRILRLIADCHTWEQIQSVTGLAISTLYNHASEGCARLGIKATGLHRSAALHAHFYPDRTNTMADPFFN